MHHTRVLRPAEGVYAFYDGRIEGYRFAERPNWVDEGALALGIASYAVVSGDRALVYDTHTSIEHARFVRAALEEEGVRSFTVVLSHWHLDHVAGTEVFGDSEVISSARTAELLKRKATAIERGELEGPPPIDPLILPTRTYSDRLRLDVGEIEVELIQLNIHSDDATVVWLADQRILLCGDTMEDTVTYVDEPEAFDAHLADLVELRRLEPERILPNHGDPEAIAGGGYSTSLISATERYIEILRRLPENRELGDVSLRELMAEAIEAGWINYFTPYEEVHRENVATVLGSVSRMGELTSASVPPIAADDHVTGEGLETIVYADFGCPYCAVSWARLRELPLRLCFRHFPMGSKHPRSPGLHAAAEAAGLQGAFWEMCDSLYADRGRVDDPHLWERAELFGLDLERFNSDRRSDAVRARVERDFASGIRGGVGGTPTAFVDGVPLAGDPVEALRGLTR